MSTEPQPSRRVRELMLIVRAMEKKRTMLKNTHVVTVVGAICALSLVACTAKREVSDTGTVQAATVEEKLVEGHAKVTKVDRKNRKVTVKRVDGHSVTLDLGPEVKNLDQIDPGDDVKVAYYESVAFDVKVPGKATPGVTVVGGADAAEKGNKPAAMGARMVTVTSTIEAISKDPPSVTLKGPEGGTRKIRVKNPAYLENVEVGDLVEMMYTQAVAVSVEETTK